MWFPFLDEYVFGKHEKVVIQCKLILILFNLNKGRLVDS